MAAPFSIDMRERIVSVVDGGVSRRSAAARFLMSHSAAIKIVRRARETGSVAPAKIGGYRKPKLSAHEETLRAIVAEKPDRTLADIQAELLRLLDLKVGQSTIHDHLYRIGLRFKKRA
jgi:putative transposase